MDDAGSAPRNHKDRRAAAKANGTTFEPQHLNAKLPEIPLKKPNFDAPRLAGHKTLYEIAEERQKELEKEGFYASEGKSTYGEEANSHQFWTSPTDEDDPPIGPLGEALVWSVSLSMLHFTLDVMVYHQYRQSIEWSEIWTRLLSVTPGLFFVVYILHMRTAMRLGRLRQIFFLIASIAAGCHLIKSGNDRGYYAVMKKAPPVGTLWVWSVVEMDLWFAVSHVVAIGSYMWWNGYGAF